MNLNSSTEEFRDITLRDLAAPLFRRRKVIVTTFLVILGLAVLIGILIPPKYTSQMGILVNRERLDPLVTAQTTVPMITENQPVSEAEINSEAQLLKSRDVLTKVVEENGLAKKSGSWLSFLHPHQTEADRVQRAVERLAREIKVTTQAKNNIIEVSYSSSNPQQSYGVLNSLGNLYLEKHVAVHRPPGSFQFFSGETQKYRDAMENSEAELRQFRTQPNAAAPDLERAAMATSVTNAYVSMHAAEQAIAADRERIQADEQQMKVTPARSATKQDTLAASRLLQDLGNTLLSEQTRRTQLLMQYDPSYPLVQSVDKQIKQTQAAIAQAEKAGYVNHETDRDPTYELLREDRARAQSDLAAQQANLAAVKRTIGSLQARLSDLDQKALTETDLQRNIKTNETNYLLYLSKQEQERTSDALDKTRIANVAIAVPPAIPALPSHHFPFYLAVGLLLALLLAIAMGYISDYFDSSFHTPKQVADVLGIHVVVDMPRKTA